MSNIMPQVRGSPKGTTSTTVSEAAARPLIPEDGLTQEAAKDILKRTLSVKTANAATDIISERTGLSKSLGSNQYPLRDIGRGSCGSVFEVPETVYAIKKGAGTEAIWNDFNLTNCAYNSCLTSLGLFEYAFRGRRVPRVPKARYFNGPDADGVWTAIISRFPEADRTRAAAFYLDHILPVPRVTRQALVRRFFQPDEQTQ
ncbi:hypothetical protein A1O1_04385 [Capronia coronata CBS 617.96]|uniref:Uncharacterized protein n=1 Tax=Capronia coronata CBS 617.96 TaxID=1182541 RepID=W9YNL6_9EURO|nr:uncharacterized protein A1O1_04385 [Capronia coronata CBS 617.96]EXJ91275.1 hypothetical protein A1O1_04385 [Capronia coronata CBS 617.96]